MVGKIHIHKAPSSIKSAHTRLLGYSHAHVESKLVPLVFPKDRKMRRVWCRRRCAGWPYSILNQLKIMLHSLQTLALFWSCICTEFKLMNMTILQFVSIIWRLGSQTYIYPEMEWWCLALKIFTVSILLYVWHRIVIILTSSKQDHLVCVIVFFRFWDVEKCPIWAGMVTLLYTVTPTICAKSTFRQSPRNSV